MKNKLPYYGIIAALVFMLVRAEHCVLPNGDTITLPGLRDTVYIPQYDTITKTIVRTRVLRDTVTVTKFVEVVRDTAYIFFADTTEYRDDLRLWQGEATNDKCQYRYTVGVLRDTVHYVNMESDCTVTDTMVYNTYTERPAPFRRSLWAGVYWSVTDPFHTRGLSVNAQVAPRWYVGVNYGPFERQLSLSTAYKITR
jgi:hypothetical protein